MEGRRNRGACETETVSGRDGDEETLPMREMLDFPMAGGSESFFCPTCPPTITLVLWGNDTRFDGRYFRRVVLMVSALSLT